MPVRRAEAGIEHAGGAIGLHIARKTLARPTAVLSGIGLHSGESAWVQILPSEHPRQGILLRNSRDGQEIRAEVVNVRSTSRCTVLGQGTRSLQTVEHLLSALAGLGVTDASVLYEGDEVPALDGSALPFVNAIDAAGVTELPETVAPLVIGVPMTVQGKGSEVLVFVPAERPWASVILDYPDRPALGAQVATFYAGGPEAYTREVAPARTYGFLSEIEALRASGLALGACADNAVGLCDDGSPDDRTPLRFHNEMARHKLLDLMGDLCLVGRPLRCGILAMRPSHALNVRAAEMLVKTF